MANSDEQVVSDLVSLVVNEIAEEMANGVDISAEAGPSGASNDEPDDWTCAICLESVATANLAVVKGCGHTYCVNCIVHWASTRTGAPRCPTCKAPFTQLKCHRNLDGSFSGAMVEESVVLIAHSSWFQNWLSEHERLKQLSRNNPGIVPPAPQAPVQRSEQALLQEEWAEEALYGYFESQFDDDDEFEDMYLARGPRMAIGNRPYGPNGFIASGRKLAAPKRGKGKGKGGGGGAGTSNAAGSNKAGAAPSGNNQATGGRRAQRKAKRAAADARDDL